MMMVMAANITSEEVLPRVVRKSAERREPMAPRRKLSPRRVVSIGLTQPAGLIPSFCSPAEFHTNCSYSAHNRGLQLGSLFW